MNNDWTKVFNTKDKIINKLEEICCFKTNGSYDDYLREQIKILGIDEIANQILNYVEKLKNGKLLGLPGYFIDEWYPCTFIEFGEEFATAIIKEGKGKPFSDLILWLRYKKD